MPRNVDEVRWPPGIEEKVYAKHGIERREVEEAFFYEGSRVRKTGRRYLLFTRTDAGRYIIVVYAQTRRVATVISARDMTLRERRMYWRK